jgi:hypothetical protein
MRLTCSVFVCVSSLFLLGNGSENTPRGNECSATIEELSDAPFSMRCVSYQRKVCH